MWSARILSSVRIVGLWDLTIKKRLVNIPESNQRGLKLLIVMRKRFKKIAWIQSHHLQWKFKLLPGKFTWANKAKHCWVMSTNFFFSKVCWQCPAMFCLHTSSLLSHPWFEFSLKVKVMGSNPGYLLKSFLIQD